MRRDDADDLNAVANRLISLADRLIKLCQDGDTKGLLGTLRSIGKWTALVLVPGIVGGVAGGMAQAGGEHLLGSFADEDHGEQVQELAQRVCDHSSYILTLPAESLLPTRAEDQVMKGGVGQSRLGGQSGEFRLGELRNGEVPPLSPPTASSSPRMASRSQRKASKSARQP